MQNKVPPMLQVKAHWESFFFFWVSWCINPETQICKACQYPRWIILFYKYIIGSFIELCPIIQQKRLRPYAATYSRRITNHSFYRSSKIILCIWRVGYRIFRLAMYRDEHAVITQPMPKCLWNGWTLYRGDKEIVSPFAWCPVNRECLWKNTQINKKSWGSC